MVQPGARRAQIDLGVLDALRGLAALYVVACHAGALLWFGFTQSAWKGETGLDATAGRIVHGLLDYSPVAVILFFLISGFCIHYRQAKQLAALPPGTRSFKLDVRAYASRRIRRLYPPFVLALLLTAACDAIGSRLNLAFYIGPKPPEISWLGYAHDLTTLLGNLALQSSLLVPSFGSDSPLWSLGYEFWFYALYPVLLLVSARRGGWLMLGPAALVGAIALGASRLTNIWAIYVLMSWCVWAAGAVLAEAYVGRVRVPTLRWFALVALAGLAALTQLAPYRLGGRGQPRDLLWACALVVLLGYVLLEPTPWLARALEGMADHLGWLGKISYTLYLVHVPWLALLAAAWFASHAVLPRGLELVAAGVASAVVLGGACWYLVERHCIPRPPDKVRPASQAVALSHQPGFPTSGPQPLQPA